MCIAFIFIVASDTVVITLFAEANDIENLSPLSFVTGGWKDPKQKACYYDSESICIVLLLFLI